MTTASELRQTRRFPQGRSRFRTTPVSEILLGDRVVLLDDDRRTFSERLMEVLDATTLRIAQIVAYAEKMGCQEAVLVYPRGLHRPYEARVSDIRMRSLPFSLEGDLDEAGHHFMRTVLGDALVYSALHND